MGIKIKDEAGLFTAENVKALETAAEAWPFEVRLVTSTTTASKDAFDAVVAKAVDGPNVIAIGIDPTHKTTIVHFGKGADVPASQWAAVISAGDGEFKEARWTDGVVKIGDQAVAARQVTTVVSQPETSPTLFLLIGAVGAIGLAVGIAIYLGIRNHYRREEAMRRLRLDREEETRWWAAHERKHGYNKPGQSSMPPPRYRPPTVTNNHGGGSEGVALGFIAGHVSGNVGASSHAVSTPSHDAGGSSSSWSSDSGGGSSDSGGGSSSW